MNFAHIVGEHPHTNQLESIVHTLLSWAPLVLSITALLFGTYVIIKRRVQTARAAIRKQDDHRL